ncbi:hypothetical protein QQP08_005528 [Theobroma cacao]|nr:hypothetical protein QQP08_005528 [Theobroma cacao]
MLWCVKSRVHTRPRRQGLKTVNSTRHMWTKELLLGGHGDNALSHMISMCPVFSFNNVVSQKHKHIAIISNIKGMQR